MAQQVIFTDANELVLLLKGKDGRESKILNAPSVQRISFSNAMDEKLFGLIKTPIRRITVVVNGLGTIEFDENRHKKYFDEYLTMLRKYCAENRVTFYDFPEK